MRVETVSEHGGGCAGMVYRFRRRISGVEVCKAGVAGPLYVPICLQMPTYPVLEPSFFAALNSTVHVIQSRSLLNTKTIDK